MPVLVAFSKIDKVVGFDIDNKRINDLSIGLDKNIVSPRPLTHDLFLSISKKTDLILEKIIIHKLDKGIFFSSLSFYNHKTKNNFSIDARTSDAIALLNASTRETSIKPKISANSSRPGRS